MHCSKYVELEFSIKTARNKKTVARFILRTKKHDHITVVLMSRQWLSVEFRIQNKFLVTVLSRFTGCKYHTNKTLQINMEIWRFDVSAAAL